MKIEITSLSSISESLQNIKDNSGKDNIEIVGLSEDTIPHLDYFIDCCKTLGHNVEINKQLLIDSGILEHFKDRVQVY